MTSYGSFRLDAYILFNNTESARDAVYHMQGFRLLNRSMRVRLAVEGDMHFSEQHSDQIVPSLPLEYNSATLPQSAEPRATNQVNLCSQCYRREVSNNIEMSSPQDFNQAGPSGGRYDGRAGQFRMNAPMLPNIYPRPYMPSMVLDENNVCLYIYLIPQHDSELLHHVALSLFQGFVGFQSLYVLPHMRGSAIVTFWTSIQARLAMSIYNGYKVDEVLQMRIRVISRSCIQYINNPNFSPNLYFV